jgi:hypothetical protein
LRWHVLTCRFKLFRRVLVTNYYNRINVIDTSTVNTNALPPPLLKCSSPIAGKRLSKILWFVGGGQINYLPKLKVEANIIDLRATNKSRYLARTESNNCFMTHLLTFFNGNPLSSRLHVHAIMWTTVSSANKHKIYGLNSQYSSGNLC